MVSRKKLILDADVSLKLAEHPANLDAIGLIASLMKTGKFELVVPDVVLEAFEREKEDVPKRYWKTQRSYVRNLRALEALAPDPLQFAEVLKGISDAVTKFEGDVPQSREAVECLLAARRPPGSNGLFRTSR